MSDITSASEDNAQDLPAVDFPILGDIVITNTESHERLRTAICSRTTEMLADTGAAPDLIDSFGMLLTEHVDHILLKFRRGQLEHGGDIRDRDLDHEMGQEIVDMVAYKLCKALPPKPIDA